MSMTTGPDDVDAATVEDRIRELEEVEAELRLVARTDCSYANYARRWLDALEEARDE